MIVKNEEKTIERLIRSVLGIVDYYVIYDTGSSDTTPEVIRRTFEQAGVNGSIYHMDFVNFGHNRTIALDAAQREYDGDFLLLLDADMVLIDNGFSEEALSQDYYSIGQKNSVLWYYNLRLVRNGSYVKCIGPTHEYYDIRGEIRQLTTLTILDKGDGGCKGDKFSRDIALLSRGLLDEPNNPRYLFYLANSYKDSHMYEFAIDTYEMCREYSKWGEELWCSWYYQGICTDAIQKHDEAVMLWWKAFETRPSRAEPIYEIAKSYRKRGMNKCGYLIAQMGLAIPFPRSDVLFIRHDVYEYQFEYELGIMCYYCDKKIEGRRQLMNVIGCISSYSASHLLQNYRFYAPVLSRLADKIVDLSKHYKQIDGFVSSTPSIVKHDGKYTINIRTVDYNIDKLGNFSYRNGTYPITINHTLCLEDNGSLLYRSQTTSDKFYKYGIEDEKLFSYDGSLFSVGTVKHDGKLAMRFGVYGERGAVIPSPHDRACEKNWAMFQHKGVLLIVYEWQPFTICNIEDGRLVTLTQTTSDPIFNNVRGSTNGMELDGRIHFICHCVAHGAPRDYFHIRVSISMHDLSIESHSQIFTFENENIEFCLGLEKEEDLCLLTYSTWDRTAKLMYIKTDHIINAGS